MADTILLIRSGDNRWTAVVDGDRYADGLCNDECLGVVASTIYGGKIPYVRTPREHAELVKARVESAMTPDPLSYGEEADAPDGSFDA